MDPIFRQTHLLLNQVNLGCILACSEVYQKNMLFLFGEQHIFFPDGYLFLFFFGQVLFFFWVPGSLLSLLLCFSAELLFCFLLFLPLCFSAFLLFAFLLLSAFHAPLLFCFCASVPFSLYYSTFFFKSCVFASLPTSCSSASLRPVLTVSLLFTFFSFIYSLLFVS